MEVLEKEEQTNLELSERYNEDERGNKIEIKNWKKSIKLEVDSLKT